MEAQQVIDKIIEQARTQAQQIIDEAQQKARRQSDAAQAEIDEYNKQTKQLADSAAQDKAARMLASARMASAKENLAAKQELLSEVFTETIKRLASMGESDYRAFMSALIKKAVTTGDEEIIVGHNEKRIDAEFIRQINSELGSKGNLKLSQQRADMAAGFILKCGKISINAAAETIVGAAREALEGQIAQELNIK